MKNQIVMQEKITIKDKIFTIRDMQVMLDRDLAELYGVETKVFNQAVKRNRERFPADFRFQLSSEEKKELVTKCDRLQMLKHSSVNPYVFTEQGVSMLSAILKSDIAIEMSIKIVRAFVHMRRFITQNALLFQRLDTIETKQLQYKLETDEKFDKIFKAIEEKDIKPTQGVFFDGQIFDAYVFISGLIKKAEKSMVLIDNYVDETVLLQLSSEAAKDVKITILTKTITKKLELDLQKHNAQYQKIEIKAFQNSHDRFLIIDQKEIYHLGASLKDLGKKWFAFSLMDESSIAIIDKINEVIQ